METLTTLLQGCIAQQTIYQKQTPLKSRRCRPRKLTQLQRDILEMATRGETIGWRPFRMERYC
ncbi:MAG: hypothetical protein WC322_04940 [Candidatus Paceibacterota bacterium]|jgi:hypothetical protein